MTSITDSFDTQKNLDVPPEKCFLKESHYRIRNDKVTYHLIDSRTTNDIIDKLFILGDTKNVICADVYIGDTFVIGKMGNEIQNDLLSLGLPVNWLYKSNIRLELTTVEKYQNSTLPFKVFVLFKNYSTDEERNQSKMQIVQSRQYITFPNSTTQISLKNGELKSVDYDLNNP